MRRRFPARAQVAPVYAVIVLMIYTWTSVWFFWKLPGWLYFLTPYEILTAFAYALVTNFVESLVVLCGPLALSLVLPRKWFCDVFVPRGATLAIASLGCLMYLALQFNYKHDAPSLSLALWPVVLAVAMILVIVYLSGRIPLMRTTVESFADRATIFIYISIPISMLSLVLVLVHWIT